MSEENKKESSFPWAVVLIVGFFGTVIVLVTGVMIYDALTTETIVVEGTIISAEYIGEIDSAIYTYDVIRVVFDNNETYDLVLGEGDHDFTVHSKMILKLESFGSDKWSVVKIIKVPDLVEEG